MTDIATTTEPLWTRARAMFARAVAAIGNPAAIAIIAHLNKALRRDIIAWLAPIECIVRRLLIADATELHRAQTRAPNCAPRTETIQLRSLGLAQHWHASHPSSQREEGRVEGRTTRRAPSRSSGNGELHPARPLPQPPPQGAGDARSAARSAHDHHSDPETWRTQFSFALPRDTRLVSNAHAPRIRALWGEYTPPPEPPPRTPRTINAADAPLRLARRLEALRRVLADPRPHAERLARLLVRAARRIPRLVQRYVWTGARTDAVDPADPRLSLDALAAAFDAPDAYKDTS